MKPTVFPTLCTLLLLSVLAAACGIPIDIGSGDGGGPGATSGGAAAGGVPTGGGTAGGTVTGGGSGGGGGGTAGGGASAGGAAGGGTAGGLTGGGASAGGSAGGGTAGDGGVMTAFAQVDRTMLEFGEQFGEGVAVGTRVTETLLVRNSGALPFTFATSFTGSPLFVIDSAPDGGSVPARGMGYVRVRFGPADGGWSGTTASFTGALVVTTSAPNLPSISIPVSARAVKP
ncbi:MAG: hypothetical protein JNJ54_20750 [Myxococcaceae bacterium]|nr:hypothetical protein [Myxococcaceae bacterium]